MASRKLGYGASVFRRGSKQVKSNIVTDVDPEHKWKKVGELGEGAYGAVLKVQSVEDEMVHAAAKVMPCKTREELREYSLEADILHLCKHPGIVKLVASYYFKDQLWILLELCVGGALDDIMLDLEAPLTEPQIKSTGRQVLDVLAYLHDKGVYHRDLKAGNILLTSTGRVRLTDFGVSAMCKKPGELRNSFIGTPYWMAPEVILCENVKSQKYNHTADVWSFAITLIELAEMEPPHGDAHPMRVLFKIPKAPPPTLSKKSMWSDDFNDFLAECLIKDYSQRPETKTLLRSPFMRNEADLAPMRLLLKLKNAPVIETLEDIPEGSDPQVYRDLVSTDCSEEERGRLSSLQAELELERKKLQEEGKMPDRQEHQEKTKTLTRTRTVVDEKGETVTMTTTRTVTTSEKAYVKQSSVDISKQESETNGMISSTNSSRISSKFEMAHQKAVALARRAMMREMQRELREEHAASSTLMKVMEKERIEVESTHTDEITEHEKYYKKEIKNLSKKCKKDAMMCEHRLKRAMNSKVKGFEKNLREDLNLKLKKYKALPKSEFKQKMLDLAKEHNQKLKDFKTKVTKEQNIERQNSELDQLKAKKKMELDREDYSWQIGNRHMYALHELKKHQLKATFLLFKYQMYARHIRESEHMKDIHDRQLKNHEKELLVRRKNLPKLLKSEKKVAHKKLVKDLKNKEKSEKKSQLEEFNENMEKQATVKGLSLQNKEEDDTRGLKNLQRGEREDLEKIHTAKKKQLMVNEATKLKELEEQFQVELRTYKNGLDDVRAELVKMYAQAEVYQFIRCLFGHKKWEVHRPLCQESL
eukprot:UC4_evm1s541